MAKMSEQEFDSKAAAIDEEWDASRREIWESAKSDYRSEPFSNAADDLQMQRFGKLYQESGWTTEEIRAWLAKRAAKNLERLKLPLPPDEREPLG